MPEPADDGPECIGDLEGPDEDAEVRQSGALELPDHAPRLEAAEAVPQGGQRGEGGREVSLERHGLQIGLAVFDALAFDRAYYRGVGRALQARRDRTTTCVVDSGGERLGYPTALVPAKVNIGDHTGTRGWRSPPRSCTLPPPTDLSAPRRAEERHRRQGCMHRARSEPRARFARRKGARLVSPASIARAQDDRQQLLALLDEALARTGDLVALDEARFLETHSIYEGRSDQQRRIVEWFGDRIAPLVRSGRPFQVLSVGCGSGMLDVPIATLLARRTGALRYVGVNPNRTECDVFERAFRGAALPGARLMVAAEPFESFETSDRFELIHFVHSLYYLSDPAAALKEARAMLGPGGRLVLFHAPCEALNDLAVRFWNKQYARPTLFAADLARLLDRWGWTYERNRVEAAVEVTPLVQGNPEIGVALRDFIIQVDGERLPSAVQDLVERYLHLIAVEERGRSHIPHPVDVFFIAG